MKRSEESQLQLCWSSIHMRQMKLQHITEGSCCWSKWLMMERRLSLVLSPVVIGLAASEDAEQTQQQQLSL